MDVEMKVFYGGLGILALLASGHAISQAMETKARPETDVVNSGPPPADRPRVWYIADQDFASCIKTEAPAKRIELLRERGGQPSTDETRDAHGELITVEVSAPSPDGLQVTVWTYYTSIDGCQAALAARNNIPGDYR